MQLRRPPQNPEAHALLTDQGAAVLVDQGDADFEDNGDAESGPMISGYPDYDRYQSESHDIAIDWRGMEISEIEPEPPEWAVTGQMETGDVLED
jgi:hypothetical protein